MFEQVPTIITFGMGFAAGTSLLRAQEYSYAVSDAGESIRQSSLDESCRFGEIYSFSKIRPLAEEDLEELLVEHSERGWDGFRAPALTREIVRKAVKVLRALPSEISNPEFSVAPDDGSLSLEWSGGYRKLVSLNLQKNARLLLTAINGTSATQGAYDLGDGQLPSFVLQQIRDIQSRKLKMA